MKKKTETTASPRRKRLDADGDDATATDNHWARHRARHEWSATWRAARGRALLELNRVRIRSALTVALSGMAWAITRVARPTSVADAQAMLPQVRASLERASWYAASACTDGRSEANALLGAMMAAHAATAVVAAFPQWRTPSRLRDAEALLSLCAVASDAHLARIAVNRNPGRHGVVVREVDMAPIEALASRLLGESESGNVVALLESVVPKTCIVRAANGSVVVALLPAHHLLGAEVQALAASTLGEEFAECAASATAAAAVKPTAPKRGRPRKEPLVEASPMESSVAEESV